MTRILCTGDLHLGAAPDLGATPGDRLRDQERVWDRVCDLALDHDVDALLFAGDAFHRRRPTPAELLAFARPLWKLAGKVDVLAVDGNHDVETADRPSALELFSAGTVGEGDAGVGPLLDLHRTPGVWEIRGVSVATLPWTPVSRLVAARGGGDRDDVHREAAGLLLETARGLRAQIPAGRPAVLLAHWSVSEASTPTGQRTDFFRETVLPLTDVEALGFDAVVLGHIHKPQILSGTPLGGWGAAAGQPVFYVGSPCVVDFGEARTLHGVWLLELDQDIETKAEFLPVDDRPFVLAEHDLTTAHIPVSLDETDSLVAAIAEHIPLTDAVVRVRYRATAEQARRLDLPAVRAFCHDAGAARVFLQPDIVREDRARVEGVDETLGPMDALDRWARAQQLPEQTAVRLGAQTIEYLEEVPA